MKKFIESSKKFLAEVKQELKNVSWPTRDDLKEGTTVVIVMSTLVAVYLATADYVFNLLVKLLLFKG